MIKKFISGKPFDTEAVVVEIAACDEKVPFFSIERNTIGGDTLNYTMSKKDVVYGLGEQIRGINKRGWRYVNNASDDPGHTEDKSSLYAAHNFIIVDGEELFGVFVDFPASIVFDIGGTDYDTLSITPSYNDYALYIITGKNAYDIVKQFRKIVGRCYIPPYWAFGAQQCRWGYRNEADVREVAAGYRENDIPLDAIYLDIDYMKDFKDFTVDSERFPDLTSLAADMKADGIRLVPIIDAGVKIEDGYDVYEEGVSNNYFCKREDGSDFVAGVWPGRTHFPDFLNPQARSWFGGKYKCLIDMGIEGFWNDMNEPAIFYSDEGLNAAMEHYKELISKPLDIYNFFALKDNFMHISNNNDDYDRFYHVTKDGEKIRHRLVHNLYGYNMTRAAGEAFDELQPDKRILMFSRSSYIGMHRYGGIWLGDNCSWWSHILLNIKQLANVNMCGFLYSGADLGGFGCNTTGDLLTRWLGVGIFSPLMRNHSALGTANQEPYRFNDYIKNACRGIIKLRYRLIPHLYSEYMKAALNDEMYFRPLAFDYRDDERARMVEDQLLLGDSLMITPIYEQNAAGRYVYLPEDMLFVKFRGEDYSEVMVMEKGTHFIRVALDEVPLFIRKNCVIPLANSASCTDKLSRQSLTFIGYADDEHLLEYTLYEDDGYSKNYAADANYTTFTFRKIGDKSEVLKSNGRKISLSIFG